MQVPAAAVLLIACSGAFASGISADNYVCLGKDRSEMVGVPHADCARLGGFLANRNRSQPRQPMAAERRAAGLTYKCEDGEWRSACDDPKTQPQPEPQIRPVPLRSAPPAARSSWLSAEPDAERIASRCASDWPDNFRMQRFCADQQRKGARELGAVASTPEFQRSEAFQRSVIKCIGDWTDVHGINWRMAAFCSERQLKAFRELGR